MTDTEALRRAIDWVKRDVFLAETGSGPAWNPRHGIPGDIILNGAERWLTLAEGDEATALRVAETVEALLSNFPDLGIGKYLILGEEFGKIVLAAITEEGT